MKREYTFLSGTRDETKNLPLQSMTDTTKPSEAEERKATVLTQTPGCCSSPASRPGTGPSEQGPGAATPPT